MSQIHIVDTSVFCSILGVPDAIAPARTQEELKALTNLSGTRFMLPVAVVYETGNIIAAYSASKNLSSVATRFGLMVQAALEIPAQRGWSIIISANEEEGTNLTKWISGFSISFVGGAPGTGLRACAVIDAFNTRCELHSDAYIRIWSHEPQMAPYERSPI